MLSECVGIEERKREEGLREREGEGRERIFELMLVIRLMDKAVVFWYFFASYRTG